MKLKIFLIILVVAFLLTGLRWTDNIGTGYLKNWFKFMRTSSYLHQRRGTYIMSDSTNTNFGWATNDTLGRAVKVRYLRNTSGDSVHFGDVVVRDNTVYVIVDTVARSGDPDTLTVALSGETEQNPLDIFVTAYSLANACSTELTGISYTQTATVETVITTATGTVFSTTEWDTISQVILLGSDANDSVSVTAYQQSCFTTTTSDDDILHCGVVMTKCADNEWTRIAYEGRCDSVKCDASSVDATPGAPVTTSNTAKKCEPRTTATAGAVLGRCLESDNTDGRIAIWLGGD